MKTDKVHSRVKFGLLIFLLVISSAFSAAAQDAIDLDMLSAQEEFKWGVKAYHRGMFNEAARAFEKALAYKPENVEFQKWLGYAWFRSGFTDAAINIWDSLRKAGSADSLLMNRLEILKQQTGVAAVQDSVRYLPAMELEGVQKEFSMFHRPSSVYPDKNGGFWVVSFGTNELLTFNSNGALTNRLNGGLEGFNHPFDLEVAPNGWLYLTEFNGDRISRFSPSGRNITKFGNSGRGDGQLYGPQYIASDEKNFIYVTDSGNRRVVKYDENGNFILSFGTGNYNFRGFGNPTGIECINGRVFVADSDNAAVYIFDYSGNYLAETGTGSFSAPEGLSLLDDTTILVADSGRVLSLDTEDGNVRLVSDVDGTGRNITKAAVDANGNLLTVDFDLNRVTVLTELSNMYSGLYLEIASINSSDFPDVIADVRVMDRTGAPFVGLAANNFVITENGYPVSDAKLAYRGNIDTHVEAVVLLDSKSEMRNYHADMIKAVNSLMNAAGSRAGLRLVSSGPNPSTDADLADGSRQFMAAASAPSIFSPDSAFDLGLRHSASELADRRGRRAVIYITDGQTGNSAFEQYHPVELAAYLKNNGISFHCVDIENTDGISEELEYICSETGGEIYYLYRPEGLGGLYDDIAAEPDGSYTLSFESVNGRMTSDDFISIEVEAFLYNRSGRESSGYFRPGNF